MATQYQSKMTYQSTMPKPTTITPVAAPVPTPIQPYSQGGNAYISGYGNYVPQSSFPIASSKSGGMVMNTGQYVPNSQILGTSTSTVNQALKQGDATIANSKLASSNSTPQAQPTGSTTNNNYTTPPNNNPIYRNPTSDLNNVLSSHPNTDYGNYAYDLSPDQFYAEIDKGANAQLDYLKQMEDSFRSQQPGIEQGITDQYNTGKSQVDASRASALGSLKENTIQAATRRDDALSAARRLYDELRRGSYQRYGGASSAGEAATTLMNLEQQRQMGSTNRDYGTAIRQIETQQNDVENTYNTNLLQLEQTKNQYINQAQQDFQNRLLSIAQNRASTENERSNARLAALTSLRTQLNNIAASHEQWKQQIESAKVQQQLSLDTYAKQLQMSASKGSNAINSLLNNVSLNPKSNVTLNGQAGYGTNASTVVNNSTGIINPSGYSSNKNDYMNAIGVAPIGQRPDGSYIYPNY